MGVGALGILLWSGGSVTLLVVLYSISVFLTFAISLFGLCAYWWRHRGEARCLRRLALSGSGFAVCADILVLLLYDRFAGGGWAATLIIGALVALCVAVRRHYDFTRAQLRSIDAQFENARAA